MGRTGSLKKGAFQGSQDRGKKKKEIEILPEPRDCREENYFSDHLDFNTFSGCKLDIPLFFMKMICFFLGVFCSHCPR